MHEYVGALHIHSNYSDGLRPIPEIAEIASQSGIDFLLFADHMTLEPLKMGMERWFGPVLSIIGYEINDADNHNHYLAFGLDEILSPQLNAHEYVEGVKKKGGTGFIAHPDEKRTAFKEHPPYPWTEWDVSGYNGIEIWNHASEWLEKLTHTNKYLRVLHPLKYLNGPEPETLKRWDMLNKESVMPGIGGLDAHAYPYRIGPITIYIFRYKVLFRGIRTHVLLEQEISENITDAKESILDALRRARCFITNYRWGDARGFSFTAGEGKNIYHMGDTIKGNSAEFNVMLPQPGHIFLLRDGCVITKVYNDKLTFKATEPGAYRVEVKKKSRPWIYSNHIRLRGNN
ncbi:MAG: histidinol-phosphatase [Candidatus Latescibacteria bacterium]|nr:histidinol-phosphatase [Candidatus Latescibacterota bacterium]